MQSSTPALRDIVLVGGGHSHVQVLKSFGMRPLPGVRLTVISREVQTPYSGMLPGYVAGYYSQDDIHIDLAPLSVFAGARLISDEVVRIDLGSNRVELDGHPPLRFDYLSINSGAVPMGIGTMAIPVKPIGQFLPRLESVKTQLQTGETIALIGGGAGGIELALSMRASMPDDVGILLVCESLLPSFHAATIARAEQALHSSGVEVVSGFRVTSIVPGALRGEDGRSLNADHVFSVTGVAAPSWPADSGLSTDAAGFIRVDQDLRSVSHPNVFASGDIACLQNQPRPKAGVFAVRQGPILAENLRRTITGKRLRRYRAQAKFLVLIGTGNRRAIASHGALAVEGAWVWRWKDWIDRRFMRKFKELPAMPEPESLLPESLRGEAPDPMRCGGCGAKLGASPLLRVLKRLPDQSFSQVALGIGDDAAVIRTDSSELILTVDGFRSLISDPYLFGRITAHHSLNDVLAMGGKGVSAMALATLPLMAEAMMEDDLYQMLRGVVDVLNAHEVPLVGGHTSEGAELSLGLSISGTATGGPLMTKADLQVDQMLIMTKALGSGVVLAGHMRGQAKSVEIEAALQSMDTSNSAAVGIFRDCGASSLTDISGFGLLGHLAEMLRASALGVELDAAAIPDLPGALRLLSSDVASSLQDNNEQAAHDFQIDDSIDAARLRLLADPQTSGGLLAGVPRDAAERCVEQLKAAGYHSARVIGRVTAANWRIVKA